MWDIGGVSAVAGAPYPPLASWLAPAA